MLLRCCQAWSQGLGPPGKEMWPPAVQELQVGLRRKPAPSRSLTWNLRELCEARFPAPGRPGEQAGRVGAAGRTQAQGLFHQCWSNAPAYPDRTCMFPGPTKYQVPDARCESPPHTPTSALAAGTPPMVRALPRPPPPGPLT